MTETKTYPYLKYIPHLVAIRLIVLSPFAIAQATAEFISNSLDNVCHDALTYDYSFGEPVGLYQFF